VNRRCVCRWLIKSRRFADNCGCLGNKWTLIFFQWWIDGKWKVFPTATAKFYSRCRGISLPENLGIVKKRRKPFFSLGTTLLIAVVSSQAATNIVGHPLVSLNFLLASFHRSIEMDPPADFSHLLISSSSIQTGSRLLARSLISVYFLLRLLLPC